MNSNGIEQIAINKIRQFKEAKDNSLNNGRSLTDRKTRSKSIQGAIGSNTKNENKEIHE